MGSDRDQLGDAPTTRGEAVRAIVSTPDGLSLLVVGDGTSAVHPLPAVGEVIIGRADNVYIKVDDPSLSRRHARITIDEKISFEDLGSANGTFVHSERLEPGQKVEVNPGVAVEVGSTVLIVQGSLQRQRVARPRGQSVRLRRVGTHDYFEIRLEEECANAEQSKTAFAVLRVSLVDPMAEDVAQEVFLEVLRAVDPVAMYGPGEYEAILTKTGPGTTDKVASLLARAFEKRDARVRIGVACYPTDSRSPEDLLARANAALNQARADEDHGDIVIEDRVMKRLHRLLERVAAGNINVLLLGETGVGKEVLARAVHDLSPRASAPFVKLNCAALTESLFESELFGHEKGAFTGAVRTKPGLIEAANGGTFFLDEIGEMPPSIQAKLLTVLEDRQVMHVGSLEARAIDVRFVAATNRDLEEEVARGNFRQDLYYRLNGVALVIPPLRERTAEIPRLARKFIAAAAEQMRLDAPPELADETLELLMSYRWPGNIRELRNVLERAVLLCTEDQIEPSHLPLDKMRGPIMEPRTGVGQAVRPAPLWDRREGDTIAPREPAPVRQLRRGVAEEGTPEWEEERRRILEALDACAGNQGDAARALGISRRTLVSRLTDYRIPRPRKADE